MERAFRGIRKKKQHGIGSFFQGERITRAIKSFDFSFFDTIHRNSKKKLPKDIHFVDGKRDALIFCVLLFLFYIIIRRKKGVSYEWVTFDCM
ncbi:hypothetical protein, partial [Mailhella sp.]